jgi:hypothetical protein
MLNALISRLKSFRDDTRGTVAVEAAVIFPFIMWTFLAMFVFFDGYRQTAINHKAANTIADMMSRESDSITNTYIDNTRELFNILADTPSNLRLRISVIKWTKRHQNYRVVWSKTRGESVSPLTHDDVGNWDNKLPVVPNQERIILVETWSTYNAPFNIGMDPVEINTFVFTRLRFSPQLRFCSTCS